MAFVVTIGGSPSASSKSASLLALARARLAQSSVETDAITVRDLPAQDLLHARANAPGIAEAVALVQRAQGVVIATPIYKAAYSGILKAFLDLLPQDALAGKVVLPVATGGSLAHMLAIDYALRPVLVALGAAQITGCVYLIDSQFSSTDGGTQLDSLGTERLDGALTAFVQQLPIAQL